MKATVKLTARDSDGARVEIVARFDSGHKQVLSRAEVYRVRRALADKVVEVAKATPYTDFSALNIKVR